MFESNTATEAIFIKLLNMLTPCQVLVVVECCVLAVVGGLDQPRPFSASVTRDHVTQLTRDTRDTRAADTGYNTSGIHHINMALETMTKHYSSLYTRAFLLTPWFWFQVFIAGCGGKGH